MSALNDGGARDVFYALLSVAMCVRYAQNLINLPVQ